MSIRVCTVVPVAKESFSFRFDPDLIARVDRARGDVSRTRWLERALEARLEGAPVTSDLDAAKAGRVERKRREAVEATPTPVKWRKVPDAPVLCKRCGEGLVKGGRCTACREAQ